jgi:hypothetical protein
LGFKFIATLTHNIFFSPQKTEIASSKGRVAQTTNVIMGGTVTDDATDEWLVLDKKVCLFYIRWDFSPCTSSFFCNKYVNACISEAQYEVVCNNVQPNVTNRLQRLGY